jgi:phytoene dehydrogenase-like protein
VSDQPPSSYDAIVVGAGPNGLTAAARLATSGWKVLVIEAAPTIGGGCRTAELLESGVRHDICAAVHPLGISSPAFTALDLAAQGLEWRHPELPLAHPLDGGDTAVLHRDLDAMVAHLGADGRRYRRLVEPLLDHWPGVRDLVLGPLVGWPPDLAGALRFGVPGVLPATVLARGLRTERARALLGGLAAHSFLRLRHPFTGGLGLVLGVAAHANGWPVAAGGSQSIVDALARVVVAHGGTIETGRRVASLRELPRATATLLDVAPGQLVAMAGGRLDHSLAGRAYRRFRHGPGVVKVDYVLSGPVPWAVEPARRAGTVHLGGTLHEVAAAEADVVAGRLPARPYVLVAQPAVADADRVAANGHRPLWAYTHVPNGASAGEAGRLEAQLDRAAPGWRDLIVARSVRGPADLEAYNANNVGGDIAGGSLGGLQLVARPRLRRDPYRTPLPGVWLCSASTPPGAGVHGMAGWHAAGRVLARP